VSNRQTIWSQGSRWTVGVLAAAVLALVIGWILFVPVADWLATHDVGNVTGALRTLRLQTARDAARGRLLTFGAGLFAAGALVFTARNFTLSRRTVELTEQGQVTDRYTRAIDQLGSKTIDITIGGIYALERIARDSPRDHPTVMEVLAACIREHSREQWPEASTQPGAELPERSTRPDVQAALTVIGRRDVTHDTDRIDLQGANLTGANLRSANLADANMRWTNLSRVHAGQANLAGAHFRSADLTKIDFSGANLSSASFRDAKLPDAIMPGANLTGARLYGADLTHADLTGADLTVAHSRGATFTGANLTAANFARADLGDVNMRLANLADANFTGADLTHADLSTANMAGTIFADANLTEAWFPADAAPPQGWMAHPGTGRLVRLDIG
jgi:uncharacterized protein YjbI with pentapeptide repeats